MFLLDTNVVSELRLIKSGKADKRVARWAGKVDADDLFLSVITIQEIEVGVLRAERKDAAKGAILRKWLNSLVIPAFSGRILNVDLEVARRSAALDVPDRRPARDGLIAATGIVHGMTIVTRNTCDFEQKGVTMLNPWSVT